MSLDRLSCARTRSRPRPKSAKCSAAISAAAPATCRSSRRRSRPPHRDIQEGDRPMLDLGTQLSSPASSAIPMRSAIVDGDLRLTYAAMVRADLRASSAAFDALGLKPGDHRRHGAAEPLGSGDAALGLPDRRDRDHAAELARQGRRARLLRRERRRPRGRLPGCLRRGGRRLGAGAGAAAHRGRWRCRRSRHRSTDCSATRPAPDAARSAPTPGR